MQSLRKGRVALQRIYFMAGVSASVDRGSDATSPGICGCSSRLHDARRRRSHSVAIVRAFQRRYVSASAVRCIQHDCVSIYNALARVSVLKNAPKDGLGALVGSH